MDTIKSGLYGMGVADALCESADTGKMHKKFFWMQILSRTLVLYGRYGKDITKNDQAMEHIHEIANLIYQHPLEQSACGIYISVACQILGGTQLALAIPAGVMAALDWYASHQSFKEYVSNWENLPNIQNISFFEQKKEDTSHSSDSVVELLENVLWSLVYTRNYQECILRCVNKSYDANVTSVIAGGLAGIYYGFDSIPKEWIKKLEVKEVIDDCVAELEQYYEQNKIFEIRHYCSYNHLRRALRGKDMADVISMKKDLDKFRGCLIGGAAGDALGYSVEFCSEYFIKEKFDKNGFNEYMLQDGLARISDNTQMALFTANGLLYGSTRGCIRGSMGEYPGYVLTAYREWYKTQTESFTSCNRDSTTCWLLNVSELFAERKAESTCLSVIEGGDSGWPEEPINNSKSCCGVTHVAPVGLYFGESQKSAVAVDMIGADIAALTHGHEMSYIPAAMLVHIIRLVSHNDEITLKEAVLDGISTMKKIFTRSRCLSGFLRLIEKAMELAESDVDDLIAIRTLGSGWCGDDALAIAIYCALKYSNDFDKALIAAVNHSGDRDSIGAITGNILGAYLGLSAIPEKYTRNLELLDVIVEIADDLYYRCNLYKKYHCAVDSRDIAWEEKYVHITYWGKKKD